MKESLLYKLHSHGLVPGVEADPNRFREVFSSKYGKVRIYKVCGRMIVCCLSCL
jgi:dolichyl-diphosphooligosaccharide---protein glycosyltransferase